jgi:hypothetical protein
MTMTKIKNRDNLASPKVVLLPLLLVFAGLRIAKISTIATTTVMDRTSRYAPLNIAVSSCKSWAAFARAYVLTPVVTKANYITALIHRCLKSTRAVKVIARGAGCALVPFVQFRNRRCGVGIKKDSSQEFS